LKVAATLRQHANPENSTALVLELSFRPGIIVKHASSGIGLLRIAIETHRHVGGRVVLVDRNDPFVLASGPLPNAALFVVLIDE
jgi:hypothetical protein